MAEKPIRILRGSLDEMATRGNQIVLRGVIDPKCLPDLRIDEYQREALPLSALNKLWQALRDGESLPDLELGMRGTRCDWSKEKPDEFLLSDPVFIIDGQQRRNAAVHILSIMPELAVRIGAMIHFSTTREWERERFKILNLERSKVSANVLLRNMRHQSAAVLTLYGLSFNEPNFGLFERVCWKQSQSSAELITARTLVTVVGVLHAHRSPAFRNSIAELVPALDRQVEFVKLDRWRKNIITFFDLVDVCWGLRNITFRDLSLQTRMGFLIQLALLLSDHQNFWTEPHESTLVVDSEWRHRLQFFPLHDPTVVQLISSGAGGYGGGSPSLLYSLMRDHMNKGLRSGNRLRNRKDEFEANRPRTFSSIAPSQDADDEELEHPH